MCVLYKDSSNESNKSNKAKIIELDDEPEDSSSYLDIWEVNPYHKDINFKLSIVKVIFLSSILVFLLLATYYLTESLFISLSISIVSLIFFLFAFSDTFFSFKNFFSFFVHKFTAINPFKDIIFWKMEEYPSMMLIINKKDAISIMIKIFKINILPENVYPTLNQFLKALNKAKISYTYQVIQDPILEYPNTPSEDQFQFNLKRNETQNTIESFQTSIYFSVYYSINGILTNGRLRDLLESVQDSAEEFISNFSANFHHTKLSVLAGNDLINAIRCFFYKNPLVKAEKEANVDVERENILKLLLKTCFMSFLMLSLTFLLISYKIPIFFILIIGLFLELSLIFLWWRDLIFLFSKTRLTKKNHLIAIDPFKDIKFYRFSSFNDTIFSYIDNHLLLASKIYNLGFATYPSLTYFDKFIRGIEKHKISFNYNLQVCPIAASIFSRECSKFLNEKTSESLEGIIYTPLDKPLPRRVKYPKVEFEKWLDMRSGIWKSMLTISTFCYSFTNDITIEDFIDLEKNLRKNSKILQKAFEDNFLSFELAPLKNQSLYSGLLSECLKNHSFRLNGTYLYYLYFQGKSLMELAKIVNEFKKGIDTRIAAEFNTPYQLKNFITIGKTINTEYLDEEVPLGLTFDQIKQLLITNGYSYCREHTKMKIVSELVKANIPCLVFDFSGKWSKLIQFFKNTQYDGNILHFKLGSSFSINLKHSGVKYDKNNLDYLNLFFDTFALTFKAEKRYVDLLKASFLKDDELNISSVALDLELKQKWERDYNTNNLLAIFREFTNQSQIFSNIGVGHEEEIRPIDFLKNNKTIIVDLSILKDLEQKVFVTFVIISKLNHYVQNSADYHKKVMIIPNIDMFFDSFYIDNNYNTVNYGKVNKFLGPFLERGFGLICCANQIHYLHSDVFNHLQNIITFKATDSRDIAVLTNQMNLQELHGTGYYSSKRNNTYQIDYLMNMQPHEIIIKRSDIYQPFPGVIEFNELERVSELKHKKVLEYMEQHGYELKNTEKRLLKKAKQTLFEKDFGTFIGFIDEIINFLNTISSVDKIGGIYKQKIKDELLKFIAPKAVKKIKEKRQLTELRDELFQILVKHRYLIESHPKKAGGSQAIRSCYEVGPKYQEALEDYFQSKADNVSNISTEIIEKNSDSDFNILHYYQKHTNREIIDHHKFQNVLEEQSVELFWKLYKMHNCINEVEFQKCLNIGESLIKDFMVNLHQSYLQKNDISIPEMKVPEIFYEYLVKNQLIPITLDDIKSYSKKSQQILSDTTNIKKCAKELYYLLDEFFRKVRVIL